MLHNVIVRVCINPQMSNFSSEKGRFSETDHAPFRRLQPDAVFHIHSLKPKRPAQFAHRSDLFQSQGRIRQSFDFPVGRHIAVLPGYPLPAPLLRRVLFPLIRIARSLHKFPRVSIDFQNPRQVACLRLFDHYFRYLTILQLFCTGSLPMTAS